MSEIDIDRTKAAEALAELRALVHELQDVASTVSLWIEAAEHALDLPPPEGRTERFLPQEYCRREITPPGSVIPLHGRAEPAEDRDLGARVRRTLGRLRDELGSLDNAASNVSDKGVRDVEEAAGL